MTTEPAVHIYTAKWQPATRYSVFVGDLEQEHIFNHSARKLVFAQCCRKQRWSSHVEMQVYYDCVRTRCIAGKGCKHA